MPSCRAQQALRAQGTMRLPWTDSLFRRLLLAQGLVVLAAVLIFGLVLTAERSVLLAGPHAVLWAPVVRQVAAGPIGAPPVPAFDLSGGLRREPGPPPQGSLRITLVPGVRALRAELAPLGIQLGTVWGTPGRGGISYVGSVQVDGAEPVFISAVGASTVPGWSLRMTVGLGVLLLLIAAISRYFVRRVTQPLASLHGRMLDHARTGRALVPPLKGKPMQAPPELQAMNQAYTQLAERLDRNERERALLLAGVSHDLRSPLARIRLAAELLPETPDNADGVAAVTRNVDLADRLIASFLEFVRAGTQRLDETVDAAAVVRQAVAGFERPAHELDVQVPERLLLHGANGLLLDRLVVNLVDNALKHGGTPVRVQLARAGDALQLTVIDTGPGLPAGGSQRLLEAFARGDTGRGVPGFGLGLAIVHQIALRLQGELRFAHSPQAGHRVEVLVPLTR
jgi:two-component system, OmpR family, osmolarity sensor histidine kinase EnvZ